MNDIDRSTMLQDRISGASLRDLGAKYGLSHEAARQLVVRQQTEHLDNLELGLMVAAKAEQIGQPAAHPTFVVAFEEGDWRYQLAYFEWVLCRLRERDLRISVTARQPQAGGVVVFQLTQPSQEQTA